MLFSMNPNDYQKLNEILNKYSNRIVDAGKRRIEKYTLINGDGTIQKFDNLEEALNSAFQNDSNFPMDSDFNEPPELSEIDDPWGVDPAEMTPPAELFNQQPEFGYDPDLDTIWEYEEIPEEMRINNQEDAKIFLKECEVSNSELLFIARACLELYKG